MLKLWEARKKSALAIMEQKEERYQGIMSLKPRYKLQRRDRGIKCYRATEKDKMSTI